MSLFIHVVCHAISAILIIGYMVVRERLWLARRHDSAGNNDANNNADNDTDNDADNDTEYDDDYDYNDNYAVDYDDEYDDDDYFDDDDDDADYDNDDEWQRQQRQRRRALARKRLSRFREIVKFVRIASENDLIIMTILVHNRQAMLEVQQEHQPRPSISERGYLEREDEWVPVPKYENRRVTWLA